RRKTAARKSRIAPKARPGSSSVASLETKVAQLTRELKEALQRQTGTSEILRAISNSRGELQSVFNAILENSTRICDAQFGVLIVGRSLLEGKAVHVHDIQADPDYNPSWVTWLGPYRTVLAVPLLRQGVPIGAIALTQSNVRPFTEKQSWSRPS